MFEDPLHQIRLRGPWQYEVIARSSEAACEPSGRIKMPDDWGTTLGAAFRGTVRYTRNFGRPTGLAADDRLVIAIDTVDYSAVISVNNQELGSMTLADGRCYFEITDHIADRNSLKIEVTLPVDSDVGVSDNRASRAGLPGGLIGEVRLEIG